MNMITADMITADIYGRCETEIANLMTNYPRACPDRRAAIRAERDGLASVIADDVMLGQIPDESTVLRYAAYVQLLADEIAP